MLRTLVAALLVVVIALVGGLSIGRAIWGTSGSQASSSQAGGDPFGPAQGNSGNSAPNVPAGPANAADIASKVNPGLVDINTTLGFQNARAAGTGMVLTANGEVLTNNHVISGATAISVTDIGNGHTYQADVVGYDESEDIAVLQLQNASGLHTVSLGDSSRVAVGDGVVAIGNAGGTGGTPSVAPGAVTAINQSITASDESDSSSEQLTGLLQVAADIQPGDSGGPLVNTDGKVVGMDTAATQGFQFQSSGGQGFAITINKATAVAAQIKSGQASATVHIGATGFLGVELSAPGTQNGGGAGGNGGNGGGGNGAGGNGAGGVTSGAAVVGVVDGSPSEQAGIVSGDVITSVDGTAIASPTTLTTVLNTHHPKDKVTLVWTDQTGQSHSASITLAEGPPN